MLIFATRLRPHTFIECHEIRNQRTVLGTIVAYICDDLFISLPFRSGGRFVGLFRSYGRGVRSTVHRTTSRLLCRNYVIQTVP